MGGEEEEEEGREVARLALGKKAIWEKEEWADEKSKLFRRSLMAPTAENGRGRGWGWMGWRENIRKVCGENRKGERKEWRKILWI